jgi:hypothetical protein
VVSSVPATERLELWVVRSNTARDWGSRFKKGKNLAAQKFELLGLNFSVGRQVHARGPDRVAH